MYNRTCLLSGGLRITYSRSYFRSVINSTPIRITSHNSSPSIPLINLLNIIISRWGKVIESIQHSTAHNTSIGILWTMNTPDKTGNRTSYPLRGADYEFNRIAVVICRTRFRYWSGMIYRILEWVFRFPLPYFSTVMILRSKTQYSQYAFRINYAFLQTQMNPYTL